MTKRPVIAGNWKMYKTVSEAVEFVEKATPLVEGKDRRVLLAVPFTAIHSAAKKVEEMGSSILIGAQNMSDASEGAFTGEVAGTMLLEAGARFVILGHSERRRLFGESSGFINRKVHKALELGIEPIVCVGETEQERDAGQMEKVVKSQLEETLAGVDLSSESRLLFAYEPVWAIGTGKVATPKEAEEAHQFCRQVLIEMGAKEPQILYGGSVKSENAATLLDLPDVDGVLVGGASLSPESFANIVKCEVTK